MGKMDRKRDGGEKRVGDLRRGWESEGEIKLKAARGGGAELRSLRQE